MALQKPNDELKGIAINDTYNCIRYAHFIRNAVKSPLTDYYGDYILDDNGNHIYEYNKETIVTIVINTYKSKEDSDKDINLIKTKRIEVIGDDLICENGVVFLGKLYEKTKLDTNFSDCIDC
jgi:hypothetical protein